MPDFVGWTRPSRYKGYVYSELGDSVSGPFVHENITALTSARNGSDLVCVTEDDKIKRTPLVSFRERDFPEPSAGLWSDLTTAPGCAKDASFVFPDGATAYSNPDLKIRIINSWLPGLITTGNEYVLLGAVVVSGTVENLLLADTMQQSNPGYGTTQWVGPIGVRGVDWEVVDCSGGNDFIVGNKEGAFAYRGRYLTEPFATSEIGSTTISDPMYFENAYLSIAETAWMHLGNEHNNKQVHRLDFNFSTGSFGHMWAYVQSDSEKGKVSGQYKGLIKNNVRIFSNLRGRRFRVKILIATHKSHPWNLREMAVGHLTGKSF